MPGRPRIDIERVKQLLAQGVTQKHIAIRLGCSPNGLNTAMKKIRQEAKS
jgi:DNA-binding CsgD family transcriptional regulator